MDAKRWAVIESLYHSALAKEPGERSSYLAAACAEDPTLQSEIESLLAYADAQLSSPAQGSKIAEILDNIGVEASDRVEPIRSAAAAVLTAAPANIGRYRILRLLGEGGMGAVYEAEQEHPRRRVALKVIKPGLAGPELLRRFEQESQALGRLQHPGIAQIHEAGTADNGFGLQPYFAMEFIPGKSLLEFAEAHRLSTRQRLEVMAKVCEAVHHAHQRGIIHRDLKPGNILVDESGQPKVLDFGVARVTDSDAHATRQTDVGRLVGTLAYMSPEQVLADPLELDTRSDVYALGVILYQLLAGRLPYTIGCNISEAVRTIREEDPASLSSISRNYRGDIETIVTKALEKDKARRYASASGLAADIQRYLTDEPIGARPPSVRYQLQKFALRNRALVAGSATVFCVLVAGIVNSSWEARRAIQAEQGAVEQRDRAAASQQDATRERDRALTAERIAADDRNRALRAEHQAKYELDRAVETEKKALEDRNRALYAEHTATIERNRAIAEQQRADDEADMANAVNRFLLYDLLAQAGPDAQARPYVRPDPNLRVRTALDRAAATAGTRFRSRPLIEASIRKTIGNAYKQLGLYPEAQSQLQRALELQKQFLGEEHAETLSTMYDLAHNLFRYQGKYALAEPFLSKVLDATRRTLGDNAPATLDAMNKLGDLYRFEGKLALAEPLLVNALNGCIRVLGEQNRLTLDTKNNLALVYRSERRYEEAANLLKSALDGFRRSLGEDHPETLIISDNLAGLYRVQGLYQQAQLLFESVLDARLRVLGMDHSDTWSTMSSLASLYARQGSYALAESLYSKILEARRRVLGERDSSTINNMQGLASLYAAEQKYAEAETLYKQVLTLRKSVQGEDNLATLNTMHALATLYFQQRKYLQAEELCSNALTVELRALGPQHPLIARESGLLSELRLDQERYAEAEALVRDALGAYQKTMPNTWTRFRYESVLGASLAGQKKYAEAEPVLLSGYDGMLQQKATIPIVELSKLKQAGEWIVRLYKNWGKPEKAAEWLEKLQTSTSAVAAK